MTPALLTFSSPALLSSHPLRRGRHANCSPLQREKFSTAKRWRKHTNASGPTALFGRRSSRKNEAAGYSLSARAVVSFADLNSTLSDLGAPGAYAIRDEDGVLQYVGYAKDVGKRLRMHAKVIQMDVDLGYSFQTYIPRVDRKDVTAELLEGILEYWVSENGGMPPGNTVDRHLWESFSANNSTTDTATEAGPNTAQRAPPTENEREVQIPVRERRTAPRRRSASRADAEPVGASSVYNNSNSYNDASYNGGKEGDYDYVEMNVDPLDPFTATSHRRTTRDGIWDPKGGADDGEDWIPIFGVVGVASIVWLLSVLGGVVSTGAPSLGM